MVGKRRNCNTARNMTNRQRLSATQTPAYEQKADTAQMLETAAEAISSTDTSFNILQTEAVVNDPPVENAEVEAGSGSLEESWVDAYELQTLLNGVKLFQYPVYYLSLNLCSQISSLIIDKVMCIKDSDVLTKAFYEALKGNPIKLKNQAESEWVCNRRRELALKAAENQFFKYRPLTLASDSASDSVKALRDEWLKNADKYTLSNIKDAILGLPSTFQDLNEIIISQNNVELDRYIFAEFFCTSLLCALDVDLSNVGDWQLEIWSKLSKCDVNSNEFMFLLHRQGFENAIDWGVHITDANYSLINLRRAFPRNYTTYETIHNDFKILERSFSRLAAAAYLRCVVKMSDGTHQQDSIDLLSTYVFLRRKCYNHPIFLLPKIESSTNGTVYETEEKWLKRVAIPKPNYKSKHQYTS